MSSTFTWLAHSRREREQTFEVLARLREQEVREELGLGAIRDAFSDQLFPGLSTVQTRAAYFLLVPWCYEHVARTRHRSRSVERQAREVEVALIGALLTGQDRDGVIGQRSRAQLQRLPSEVYWNGLLLLGLMRRFESRSAFHAFAQAAGRNGDVERLRALWDVHLPAPPEGFPETATLALRGPDAAYLPRPRLASAPGSLLEHLVLHEQDVTDLSAAWDVPAEGMGAAAGPPD